MILLMMAEDKIGGAVTVAVVGLVSLWGAGGPAALTVLLNKR